MYSVHTYALVRYTSSCTAVKASCASQRNASVQQNCTANGLPVIRVHTPRGYRVRHPSCDALPSALLHIMMCGVSHVLTYDTSFGPFHFVLFFVAHGALLYSTNYCCRAELTRPQRFHVQAHIQKQAHPEGQLGHSVAHEIKHASYSAA